MIGARILGIVLFLCVCAPASTQASEMTNLKVAFKPYRLGAQTSIEASFRVATPTGELPAPITKFELRFPTIVGFATSSLGLAICHPAALEAGGLAGCSPNAQLGAGRALVVVPFGPEAVDEESTVTVLKGPPHGEEVGVLLYTNSQTPVSDQELFQGEMLEGNDSFGELLETNVPLIPSVPGAGDASITSLQLVIDPHGLTYYKRVNGETVGYHPRGLEIPERCPTGGFHFGLFMQFADGSTVPATYAIPCPASHQKRRRLGR